MFNMWTTLNSRQTRRLIAGLRRGLYFVIAAALVLATVAAISLFIARIPQWQSWIASLHDPKDRVLVENEILKSIFQVLGGAFFGLGVYFTWRNFRLAQEGQITQRFNDAIEHLGSDKPEIRLGGIYALARIARDSPKDHMSVMHVFSSYVRENSRRTPVEPVASEVQAILTMIARRSIEFESQDDIIDLRDAFLPAVNLRGAQLERVNFEGSTLARANLQDALLRGADFRTAILESTYLRGADLRDADLKGADLRHGSLRGALLKGADIFGAKLEGTTLLDTDLSGVQNPIRSQIALAVTDETTILPNYSELQWGSPSSDS